MSRRTELDSRIFRSADYAAWEKSALGDGDLPTRQTDRQIIDRFLASSAGKAFMAKPIPDSERLRSEEMTIWGNEYRYIHNSKSTNQALLPLFKKSELGEQYDIVQSMPFYQWRKSTGADLYATSLALNKQITAFKKTQSAPTPTPTPTPPPSKPTPTPSKPKVPSKPTPSKPVPSKPVPSKPKVPAGRGLGGDPLKPRPGYIFDADQGFYEFQQLHPEMTRTQQEQAYMKTNPYKLGQTDGFLDWLKNTDHKYAYERVDQQIRRYMDSAAYKASPEYPREETPDERRIKDSKVMSSADFNSFLTWYIQNTSGSTSDISDEEWVSLYKVAKLNGTWPIPTRRPPAPAKRSQWSQKGAFFRAWYQNYVADGGKDGEDTKFREWVSEEEVPYDKSNFQTYWKNLQQQDMDYYARTGKMPLDLLSKREAYDRWLSALNPKLGQWTDAKEFAEKRGVDWSGMTPTQRRNYYEGYIADHAIMSPAQEDARLERNWAISKMKQHPKMYNAKDLLEEWNRKTDPTDTDFDAAWKAQYDKYLQRLKDDNDYDDDIQSRSEYYGTVSIQRLKKRYPKAYPGAQADWGKTDPTIPWDSLPWRQRQSMTEDYYKRQLNPAKPPVDPSKPPVDPSKPPVDPSKPPADPSKGGGDKPPVDPSKKPVDPAKGGDTPPAGPAGGGGDDKPPKPPVGPSGGDDKPPVDPAGGNENPAGPGDDTPPATDPRGVRLTGRGGELNYLQGKDDDHLEKFKYDFKIDGDRIHFVGKSAYAHTTYKFDPDRGVYVREDSGGNPMPNYRITFQDGVYTEDYNKVNFTGTYTQLDPIEPEAPSQTDTFPFGGDFPIKIVSFL